MMLTDNSIAFLLEMNKIARVLDMIDDTLLNK